jgi:hypothetical protein
MVAWRFVLVDESGSGEGHCIIMGGVLCISVLWIGLLDKPSPRYGVRRRRTLILKVAWSEDDTTCGGLLHVCPLVCVYTVVCTSMRTEAGSTSWYVSRHSWS